MERKGEKGKMSLFEDINVYRQRKGKERPDRVQTTETHK